MVCCWVVTRGSVCVWETGISILRGGIFIGEVKEANVRDEEELGVGISTVEKRVIEMEGMFI